ncbi:MAG: carbohydrate ABC transporter permease [Clostridia bacterium]|nr:carbohydrate ABC transporter permease [Clostridia bacterium]
MKKTKKALNTYNLVVGIILAVYSIFLVGLLVWTFMVSMKTQDEFWINSWPWVEGTFEFKYIEAMLEFRVDASIDGFSNTYYDLSGLFMNSILYSLGSAIVSTVSPLVVAYVASKYKYKFSKFLPKFVLTVLMIPVIGSTASTIQMLRSMQIFDTYFGALALKAGFTSMYFLVFYGAFQSLSWEYAEAAFVDGASHARVMFGIMIPLIKPMIFSVFIIFFVSYWNDYTTALTYYPSRPTAALGLYYFNRNTTTSAHETMLLTGCMLVSIPVIVIFLIFSEKLMGNISMGGIKG